jgi:hypothetical protein
VGFLADKFACQQGPHFVHSMSCICARSRLRELDSLQPVNMDSLQELEAQVKDIKKRKAEANAAGRAQRRNAAKRAKRQSTHLAQVLHEAGVQEQCPKLEVKLQAQLLMLLELADCNADVVASYALGQGRIEAYAGSGLDPHDYTVRQAIASAVHSLHLAAAENLMVDYTYVHGNDFDMQSLGRYVVEHKVFTWLLEQNCKKGSNPGGGLVREMASKFVSNRLPLHIQHGMRNLFLSGGRLGRYWLTSFKKKWDAKIGHLGIGVDLDPAILEQKEPWPA